MCVHSHVRECVLCICLQNSLVFKKDRQDRASITGFLHPFPPPRTQSWLQGAITSSPGPDLFFLSCKFFLYFHATYNIYFTYVYIMPILIFRLFSFTLRQVHTLFSVSWPPAFGFISLPPDTPRQVSLSISVLLFAHSCARFWLFATRLVR